VEPDLQVALGLRKLDVGRDDEVLGDAVQGPYVAQVDGALAIVRLLGLRGIADVDRDGRKRRDLAEAFVGSGVGVGAGADLDDLTRRRGQVGKGQVLADVATLADEAAHGRLVAAV